MIGTKSLLEMSDYSKVVIKIGNLKFRATTDGSYLRREALGVFSEAPDLVMIVKKEKVARFALLPYRIFVITVLLLL